MTMTTTTPIPDCEYLASRCIYRIAPNREMPMTYEVIAATIRCISNRARGDAYVAAVSYLLDYLIDSRQSNTWAAIITRASEYTSILGIHRDGVSLGDYVVYMLNLIDAIHEAEKVIDDGLPIITAILDGFRADVMEMM